MSQKTETVVEEIQPTEDKESLSKENKEVKTEGTFKVKKKTPKKLTSTGVEKNVIKVDLSKSKKEKDAIPIGETKEMAVGEQTGDSTKVDEPVSEPKQIPENKEEKVEEQESSPLQEIPQETIEQEAKEVAKEVKEAQRDEKITGEPLPENIQKVVDFMKDTGGTLEDYVRLNADYSNVNENALLREYYKSSKPHLNEEEINFIIEDSFSIDEELEEERDIKKKKLAYKDEIAKAKAYLETLKDKYYTEIKLRPGLNQEQKKAMDFFNRYHEEQEESKARHNRFIDNTKNLLNDNFKGFDFNVGEKKFRYGVKDPSNVANSQSNIADFIGTFLDEKGEVKDTLGYHKALYSARNADTIAQHFYEQGKTDAVKESLAKSKNITTEPRKTASGEVFIDGFKVKAISGLDSSKLRIKRKTINN